MDGRAVAARRAVSTPAPTAGAGALLVRDERRFLRLRAFMVVSEREQLQFGMGERELVAVGALEFLGDALECSPIPNT